MSSFSFQRLLPWVDIHGLPYLVDVVNFVETRSASFLLSTVVFCVAVWYGHLPLLRDFGGPRCHHLSGLDFTMAMNIAAKNGHVAIVQWLHANRKESCTSAAIDDAALRGHVHVVDYLHRTGLATFSSRLSEIMLQVVAKGDVGMVEWLHRHRTRQWPRGLMDAIAASGNVSMMAYFHVHTNERCTTQAMDVAASRGHLEMVQFLHYHRHEGCTTQAIDLAGGNGHLDIVQWLVNNRHERCSWNTIYLAACNGHVRMLRFLFHIDQLDAMPWRCASVVAQTSGRLDALAMLNQVKSTCNKQSQKQQASHRRRHHGRSS
ncbi:hypothetical protein AaE_009338 [Aphanomyces astaci]|uniref:Uncharacterized protein n=1 Tax=Aphanomyces astaci TaxID=112090 RepID=A0A6A5ACQ9_APHAT|nr:hypothetical protein AaE_009338 [Aphanomyces astaci]